MGGSGTVCAKPRLTVVVCSYNGATDLERGLPVLLDQVADHPDVEVVVVDNSSTDRTPELLRLLAQQSRSLRCVSEPTLGLSVARNTGWQVARGDVVAYLDDDAVVRPGWVEAVLQAFDDELTAGMAGRIELRWPYSKPAWLPKELEALYAALDLGDDFHRLEPPEQPWGANMAIRRADLEAVGGFRTDLGRKGTSLACNEEMPTFQGLYARGRRIVYQPAAVVDHYVRANRVNPRWLLRRSWAQGISDAVVSSEQPGIRVLVRYARPLIPRSPGEPRAAASLKALANSMRWLGFLRQMYGPPKGMWLSPRSYRRSPKS